MNVLKKLLLGLLAVVALLVVIGLLLPSSVHVERSATIAAPSCTLFALLNGYGRFNEWSPWAEADPATRYAYEGPRFGVGARMSWESDDPDVGSGSQEIVASEPWSRVGVKLDFGEQGTADAFYRLEPAEGGTTITWGFDTGFGMNLVGRYFGLLFDSWIGKDYEKGLASLKGLAEGLPATDWCDLDLELVETEARPIAYVRGTSGVAPEEIGPALGAAYGQVMGLVAARGLQPAGQPLAIANFYDPERGYGFDAAIPLAAKPEIPVPEDSPVQFGATWAGPALKVTHVGPYTGLHATYEKIMAALPAHGLEPAERSWEEYVSDPGETPEEELITLIYFPVK